MKTNTFIKAFVCYYRLIEQRVKIDQLSTIIHQLYMFIPPYSISTYKYVKKNSFWPTFVDKEAYFEHVRKWLFNFTPSLTVGTDSNSWEVLLEVSRH